MNVQQLAYFRAVGRVQNVTQAAEQLAMTQPALSRSLARLERELGIQLFERHGRNVRLTRFGEAFLPHAERALRELEDARRKLDDLDGTTHGTIALGFLHTLGAALVPRLVHGFKSRHPGVRFTFRQNTGALLKQQLFAGEIDLCLTSGPVANPDLAWINLGDEDLILIVPPAHRFAKRRSMRLSEAVSEAFISYKPDTAMRELSDDLCRAAGFTPQIAFEGDEPGTVGGFVAAGLGIAIVPTATSETGGVVRVRVSEPVARRSIGATWVKDRYLCAAARAFRDYAVNEWPT